MRAVSAISFRGLVSRREVMELVMKATHSTTTAVKKKMEMNACHSSVMSEVCPVARFTVLTVMGVPATKRFSGNRPPRVVIPL